MRFYSLDGLRGLAALAVVFWHWQSFLPGDPTRQPLYAVFAPLYNYGFMAVDLFFTLSGFVFFWLYRERVGAGNLAPQTFALLRFSRIYPLHLLTLLAVVAGQAVYQAAHGASFVHPHNDPWHFVLHLFLLNSFESGWSFNAPAWSISVEAMLYAAFYLVARRGVNAGTALALSAAGFLLIQPVNELIGRGIGSFFLGGFVTYLYAWTLQCAQPRKVTAALLVAAAALWAAELALALLEHRIHQPSVIRVLFPLTVLALAASETVFGSPAKRIAWLGDISYSVYLWHFPLQLAFVLTLDLDYSQPVALAIYGAALIGLSLASYRLFELPVQSWLRRTAPAAAPFPLSATPAGPGRRPSPQ
jgi:peptidoglycan/LPS O-acetylase OafA/YrhL